ncbi:MAG: ribosome biogenesis GTPase YlqF [Proteobacteria bacterium]|nr:ribosome biogenesis GTPase YlqF [Pseudomonadota bacterium]
MSISWYPGHMHKASKELAKLMREVNIVIEVLDARAPAASSNPLLPDLSKGLPCIKLLNKADLADPEITSAWQKHFNSQKHVICLINGLDQNLSRAQITEAAKKLQRERFAAPRSKHELAILGSPNVGKSTLLNKLADKKLAKTGNEPALTRYQQRIKLDEGWYLVDTPGMLWPKLDDQAGAQKLAILGSIRNTAVNTEDIAWFAAELMLANFRANLITRYAVTANIQTAEQLLEKIAERRGGISRGGRVNLYKASEALLNDLRSGKLGRISLEQAPEMTPEAL